MRRTLLLLLLLAVCAAGATFWRRTYADATPPAPSRPAWRHPNEQSWLVADTLDAIAALGAHARQLPLPVPSEVVERRPAPAGAAVFDLRRVPDGAPAELTVRDHLFTPAAYVPFASAVLGAGTPGTADAQLVGELATPTVESLAAASGRVSAALTADPRAAAAHGDAALVLAAFAFREAAAGHTDPRREMTRITAHLAMAQALAPGAETAAARLAHLTLLVLAGRTADAVSRLDALPPTTDPSEAAWRRALRMRATLDWRAYTWKEATTLLERLAWARAFEDGIASDHSYTLLAERPEAEQRLADWGRLKLVGWVGVRTCHTFGSNGAAGYDIAEALQASASFGERPLAPGEIVAALDDEPGPTAKDGRARVLDWGRWAAFEQRHLGARLSYALGCWENVFGLPQQIPAELQEQEAIYGHMRLFPFEAQRVTRTPADYERFAKPAAAVVMTRPEVVTPHLWNLLHHVPTFVNAPPPVPDPTTWFDPPSPFGTFFHDGHRAVRPVGHPAAETIDAWSRLDPWNTSLRWLQLQAQHGEKPPYEAIVTGFGSALEWKLPLMRYAADQAGDRKDERRRWYTRTCEADIDTCHNLGFFLIDEGQEKEAAEVLRRYWREGEDRVWVANRMRWLVEYDETHNLTSEAEQIARDAASAYSYRGLETLAWLFEKRGEWEDAAKLQRQMADRYEAADGVYEFFGRAVAAGHREYEKDRTALVDAAFPDGRRPLPATPSGAPVAGVLITSVQPAARAAGLEWGDVLVALDGIEIRNDRQFSLQRVIGTDPSIRFLVYRHGAYKEVVGKFEKRIIPASFSTFPAKR